MAASGPAAVPSPSVVPDGGTQDISYAGRLHNTNHNDLWAEVVALWNKLGITDSPAQDAPAANRVLGSLATGKAAWRKVVAADVDTATRLQQSGHVDGGTGSPTITSGVYVDMIDMAVTLTTTGGDLIVVFDGAFSQNTTAQSIFVALKIDSGPDIGDNTHNFQHTGQAVAIGTNMRFSGVAAGAHTIKARWSVSGGQGTAVATYRRLTVQEVK